MNENENVGPGNPEPANEVQDPSEPHRVENDVQTESNEADGSVDAPPAAADGNQDVPAPASEMEVHEVHEVHEEDTVEVTQPVQDQSASTVVPAEDGGSDDSTEQAEPASDES